VVRAMDAIKTPGFEEIDRSHDLPIAMKIEYFRGETCLAPVSR
jgi:hypothetical protein